MDCKLVRVRGVEPPRLAAPEPKSGASACFATRARVGRKEPPSRRSTSEGWCECRDSNSDAFRHGHLKPARLPVPPHSHMGFPLPRVRWCSREDSNFHVLRHSDLNAACLPIPPRLQTRRGAMPARRSTRNGRSSRIRTCDPLVPNEVRYQAAPYSGGGRWRASREVWCGWPDSNRHGFPAHFECAASTIPPQPRRSPWPGRSTRQPRTCRTARIEFMVGVQRFELWTPGSQNRCSTRLSYTPKTDGGQGGT